MSDKKLILREAKEDDVELLFKWANDPVVRKNSFNESLIAYEDHVSWFDEILEDSTVCQFILIDGNIPIGQIRLNINNNEAEISYSIGAEFRGKGYGHKILQLMTEVVQENYPEIKTLRAKVKQGNAASSKLFMSEGYDLDYICYTREI